MRIIDLQLIVCTVIIQSEVCMYDFPVRTAMQLPIFVRAFRKQAGYTQAQAAVRLGVTQQSYSALERNADKMSAERLLQVLSIFGADVILRDRTAYLKEQKLREQDEPALLW